MEQNVFFQFLNLVIERQHPTRKLSTAGEEGLDVIFMEAVVLQHSVELLKILNVTLERNLLLPATCSIQIFRGHREHSTALFSSSLISHCGVTLSLAVCNLLKHS